MTNHQLEQMKKIFQELSNLNEDLCSDSDNNNYLEMDESESSVIIIGNTEGFINLASHILEFDLNPI